MKLRTSFRRRTRRTAAAPVMAVATPSAPISASGPVDITPVPLNIGSILVPLDFSEHSQRALQYAVSFASAFNAKLTLLHVVEPVVYPAEFGYAPVAIDALNKSSQSSAQERLESFIRQKVPARLRDQALIRNGSAFDEITRAARELGADLIILSTHGYTGLKHVLMGSTAERVVRHAPCPVLVLRPRVQG